jgi:membrane-bound ClpP family serine protease
MLEKIFITLVAAIILYELFEHVILPLFGLSLHRRGNPKSGKEGLIGETGVVLEWRKAKGIVLLRGEYWQASGPQNLSPGKQVKVESVDGLKLRVVSFENSNNI